MNLFNSKNELDLNVLKTAPFLIFNKRAFSRFIKIFMLFVISHKTTLKLILIQNLIKNRLINNHLGDIENLE